MGKIIFLKSDVKIERAGKITRMLMYSFIYTVEIITLQK